MGIQTDSIINGNSVRARSFHYSGISNCISSIYREGGITAVYRGFNITVIGAIIFKALHIGGYGVIKDSWGSHHQKTIMDKFLAAQVLTTIVGTVCYPLDTVKRRVMMNVS